MDDILRFIAWGVALYLGLWLIAFTDPMVVRVFIPRDELRLIKNPELYAVRQASPEESTRLQQLLLALEKGQATPNLAPRVVRGWHSSSVFLRSNDQTYAELVGPMPEPEKLYYTAFRDGQTTRVIAANTLGLRTILSQVPSSMAHPLRPVGCTLLGAGWAAFWLIPWRKRSNGDIFYSVGASIVGPMLIGSIIGGTAFFLTILVATSNGFVPHGSIAQVYTGTTIAATIISLPGPIIWLIGLKYGQFSVEICPSELIVRRGSQTRAIPADSIAEVSVARRYPPKWLLALYALAALLSPRYSGTFLIAGSRGNPILRLVLKNGAWVEFSHEMLQGMDKLKSWFLQHNIPTAEPLRSVKKEDVSRGTMLLSPILLHPRGSVRISYVHLLLGTTGLVWSAFWLSQWNPLPPL